jgi:hypothetical protein
MIIKPISVSSFWMRNGSLLRFGMHLLKKMDAFPAIFFAKKRFF